MYNYAYDMNNNNKIHTNNPYENVSKLKRKKKYWNILSKRIINMFTYWKNKSLNLQEKVPLTNLFSVCFFFVEFAEQVS